MTDIQKTDFVSLRSMPVILLLLTSVAGSIDVIGYLKLGEVFTANMTGNTVLLGIALGRGKSEAAIRSFIALIGFVTG